MLREISLYRKVFRDICRGYSLANIQGEQCYIKHLTTNDQVDLEDIYEKYFEQAKKKGVPTEEDMLELLKRDGQWKAQDDTFIKTQRAFIEGLIKNKKNIVLLSKRQEHEKLIEIEQSKLDEKLILKDSLLGSTCEKYAGAKLSDFYIVKSYFKDKEFTRPFFSEDEFEELSFADVRKLVIQYNSIFDKFSEENIQNLVLTSFYEIYFSFCENCTEFYGKPVCKLSTNQIQLITYTRVFKNILEQNQNIPERIKKDPKALLDFASTSEKEKDRIQEQLDKDGATTVFGATKEDYEYLGVDMDAETKPVSLHEEAKKKGGSLSMEDLIKLTGS